MPVEKVRTVRHSQFGYAVGDVALLNAVFGPTPGAPLLPPPLVESVTRSYGGAVNGPEFMIRHS
jgi:hypothetical protein